MTILRIGSTSKYSEHWDQIFGGKKKRTAVAAKSTKSTGSSAVATKSASAKPAKKKGTPAVSAKSVSKKKGKR